MDDKIEISNDVLEVSAESNIGAEEIHSTESSHLNQINNSMSDLTEEEGDYITLFDYKKKELDKIQNDLNELMVRLNNFITDSQDDPNDSGEEIPSCEKPCLEQDQCTEKQDGPQEKDLIKQNNWENFPTEDIYTCDGLNPPEVNWDILAPFIQNIVGDLQKIRNLNQMTNSVLQRIRSITGLEDTASE